MSELAGRIKAWRHALGLTQEEFARRAGIPKRTLVGYENAEREPGSTALAAIARTGVDMRWLLTGEGEMRLRPVPEAAFEAMPYGRRLEKIGQLLAGMDEQDAAALLDELYARAQDKAEAAALRRALMELRAEVERLKKTA